MPANISANLVGSVVTVTTANAIANNAYAVAADKMTLDWASTNGLLVNFTLNATFGAAPTAGTIQLIAVDWSLDTTPIVGPAPLSSLLGRLVGSFTPQPSTGNASTSWRMSLNDIRLNNKTDYYLFNNGTGQSLSASSVLKAQVWTPGNP